MVGGMEVDHVDPVAQTVVRAKLRQKPVRVPSAARVAGAHTNWPRRSAFERLHGACSAIAAAAILSWVTRLRD
jgi:hypothetical protein